MGYLGHELALAVALILHGDPLVLGTTWVTVRLGLIATGVACLIGLPTVLVLGLGRFRGRRALIVLADASLALPPVVIGVAVLLLTLPGDPFGGLRIEFTLTDVTAAQSLIALPYVVALGTAALQGRAPELVRQARALGARPRQVAGLALREAWVGLLAAVIAALGAALSEIGAVIIVGANIEGRDQTLGSALLQRLDDFADYPTAIALGIMLLAIIAVLIGTLTLLQQYQGGLRWRLGGG